MCKSKQDVWGGEHGALSVSSTRSPLEPPTKTAPLQIELSSADYSGEHLRICPQGYTCCTSEIEGNLAVLSLREMEALLKEAGRTPHLAQRPVNNTDARRTLPGDAQRRPLNIVMTCVRRNVVKHTETHGTDGVQGLWKKPQPSHRLEDQHAHIQLALGRQVTSDDVTGDKDICSHCGA
ncbi:Glypican-1 [Liparis tanakae]|uniref:Glypican-1 n=1 Tax=Liparis tanakae TaxID=230148 RepID=A0A4Z2G203_9TELE|nr:Glypican-1 [Liparis tanakae]